MNENFVSVVTGQRGCGKSTYIRKKIQGFSRVLIYDLLGEFEPTVFDLNSFFAEVKKKNREQFFYISYFNPKSNEEDFYFVCKTINKMHNVIFVLDELDYFCSATYCPPNFAEIIKRGRHQELGVLAATRRPHEIPRLVTSQVTEFVTFRHVEPRDLAYLKDICGFDEDQVKALPNYHYLEWKEGTITEGVTEVLEEEKGKPTDEMGMDEFTFETLEGEPLPVKGSDLDSREDDKTETDLFFG
jgi:hypothetical protein